MKKIENKQIIVIAGPTASGKTMLAIDIAKEVNGEIINADSRSIYREMDIGTGKPARQLTVYGLQTTDYLVDGVPHHLFDIKNPDEDFNVSEFKNLAKEKITEIQNSKHIPIIVGGTGLYIDAMVYDYKMPSTTPDKAMRKELDSRETEDLFKELKKIDPETAKKIDPKNK
ncbi:tRNA (adenosine(37)-N6)-dimethylallyltransferase MiaA, partial [bacterium (Candidatus Howlettbacteria) CG_4_10_14_0_8_um_filter_40_9]